MIKTHRHLVTGADGETRVVVGSIVHQTLASRRICLFIESAHDRELACHSGLQRRSSESTRRHHQHSRSFGPGRELGVDHTVRSRNPMLHMGTGDALSVVSFDVEYLEDGSKKGSSDSGIRELTIGTISISNHNRVHKFGAYMDRI